MSCEPRKIFVGKVPGEEKLYVIAEKNVTAARALEIAGITIEEGYTIQVNGTQVAADTEVNDGDKVLLVRNDETITITIGKSPGVMTAVKINGRKKVRDGFAALGLDTEEALRAGWTIRVGDNPSDLDTDLKDGDIVMLIPQCEGN